jgi:NADP-dependent 3-hydroxy acid dehydrogenase YdfG
MAGPLAGRAALVTGASSGIGESAALALAEAGAKVAVAARRADRLEALVRRIEAAGGEAVALPGDVADEAAATRIVEDAVERLGRLDILVNAAGVTAPGGVENADTGLWRRVLDVNLMAALYTCKAAIPSMKAQGFGDIINISSTAGLRAAGAFGPYSASKFGLTALTEGLRQEVGGYGVRVCIVEPGATATEIAETIADPKVRDEIRGHVSKEGAMQPKDIGASIVFVCSLPPRANVSEMLILPTSDTAPL